MKIFKKLLNFFKPKRITIKEVETVERIKKIDYYDDVRLLNFSYDKKGPIEIAINSIKKDGDDEYNIIYRIYASISMEEFNEDIIIDVLYRKDWHSNNIITIINEQCHMLGIDCTYNFDDPIYIKYSKLTHDRRRTICNIIQSKLGYTKLLKLLEKQKQQSELNIQ